MNNNEGLKSNTTPSIKGELGTNKEITIELNEVLIGLENVTNEYCGIREEERVLTDVLNPTDPSCVLESLQEHNIVYRRLTNRAGVVLSRLRNTLG